MNAPELLSNSIDGKRLVWRKNRPFRKWAIGLAVLWLIVFLLPDRINEMPRWQNPYEFGALLILGAVFFITGVFGLYRCSRGNGCLDISIILLGWPFVQLFVFTCDPFLQAILIGVGLGDIIVGSLLPPGTISKVMYELWVQAKQEAVTAD